MGDGGYKGPRKHVGFWRAAQLADLDDFLDGEKIFLRRAQQAEVQSARALNFDVALAVGALGVKQDGIDVEAARQRDWLARKGRNGFLPEISSVHQIGADRDLERHFGEIEKRGVQALNHGQRGPFLHFDAIGFERGAKARRQAQNIQAGKTEHQFLQRVRFQK